MGKPAPPELKKYMDKRLFCNLQGNRKVVGTLRGFDIFMNIVLDDASEETNPTNKKPMGTIVIRGNSVISLETLEAVR